MTAPSASRREFEIVNALAPSFRPGPEMRWLAQRSAALAKVMAERQLEQRASLGDQSTSQENRK